MTIGRCWSIEACKLVHCSVPDDVAVLGVDDDVLVCDLADPPISSIALNTEARDTKPRGCWIA